MTIPRNQLPTARLRQVLAARLRRVLAARLGEKKLGPRTSPP
jgi:hypothetical protein